MAKTVTRTITVTLSGDGFGGAPLFSSSSANTSGIPPSEITTANGPVTVTVPANANGVVLVPPPGSVVTKTIRGVSGDTGVVWQPAGVFAWDFGVGALASFVINASAVENITAVWT